ncbi:MAG: hypothetical protein M1814_000338 [Vezdaea aestivalis]|nr:MAG: hypothetical protein M1814_000338 [Vezdaea aestivalis]
MAIVVSSISSWFSTKRKSDTSSSRPSGLRSTRIRYFGHPDKIADLPKPTKSITPAEPLAPAAAHFAVYSVRRYPKIEDEDAEFMASIGGDFGVSSLSLHPDSERTLNLSSGRISRTGSVGNMSIRSGWTTVPWGGRIHRTSWSSQQFSNHTDGLVEDYQRGSIGSTEPLTRGLAGYGSEEELVPPRKVAGAGKATSPSGFRATPEDEEIERGSTEKEEIPATVPKEG